MLFSKNHSHFMYNITQNTGCPERSISGHEHPPDRNHLFPGSKYFHGLQETAQVPDTQGSAGDVQGQPHRAQGQPASQVPVLPRPEELGSEESARRGHRYHKQERESRPIKGKKGPLRAYSNRGDGRSV